MILSGAFTGVPTTEISYNPENANFLHGYYKIKNESDRIKHLENLSKRVGLNLNNAQGGLAKFIKDLRDDPYKFGK
tara:strand:+ start:380 stop:607 length:228 start_codon:yes stop_codon:yes gene_type:complete